MEKKPVLHTKWCGKHWIHLDEVTSTNDYLKQGDFPDGTAVIADRQTAGKGRQGKTWSEAPVGQAMYLSVLFHSMKISDMGLLPLLCGLAAARSLGSPPERTIVFEDALHAAQAARRAGFLVAGVYDPSAEGDQEALRAVCHWYLPSLDDRDFLARLG